MSIRRTTASITLQRNGLEPRTAASSKYVTDAELAARLEKANAINAAGQALNANRQSERRGAARTFVHWFTMCNPCADAVSFDSEPGIFTVRWSDGWRAEYHHNTSDGITKIRYSVPGERGTFEVPIPVQPETIQ